MGATNPASPRRAASHALVSSGRCARPVLTYDGKAVPWHVEVRHDLVGLPILGQRLAEAWRENA